MMSTLASVDDSKKVSSKPAKNSKTKFKQLSLALTLSLASALLPVAAKANPDRVTCQATTSLSRDSSLIYRLTGTVPEVTSDSASQNLIGSSLSLTMQRRDSNGTTTLLNNSSMRDYEAIAPDADYSQIPFIEAFRAQPNDGRRLYAAPASVHGLYASLRPINGQPQQMQIVHYLSSGQPVLSAPGSCTVSTSSTDPLIEPPLQVVDGNPLPLPTDAERRKTIEEGYNSIQSWINIAGVGATSPPTQYTEALEATYLQQQALNPYTATFLGVWQGDPLASGYPYYLSILPAKEADQVCIVEYQRGQQIDAEPEPAIFTLSKATVTQDNLLSPRLRSSLTASQTLPFYNGMARFLTVQYLNPNSYVRAFSLTDRSALYNGFSPRMLSELSQAMSELDCLQ